MTGTGDSYKAARRRAALLLFVAVAALYLVTTHGKTGGGDTGWRWYMGHQVAHLHQPTLEDPPGQPPHPTHRWWLGDPLLMAMGDLVAQGLHRIVARVPEELASQAIACFGQALSGALVAVVLMLWLTDLGHGLGAAVGTAALVAVGTLVWKYTTDCYYEIHQALFLIGALYTAWIAGRQGSVKWLALSAVCFSLAWLVKIQSLMFLPAIAWMWMVTPEENSTRAPGLLPLRFDRIKAALLCVPIFLPFWLAEVGFDYWRFGHWPVAVWERDTNFTGWGFHNLPAGLWDVTFGPVRGLAWYCPLTVLALVFLPAFLRRMKAGSWAILYCLATALALAALIEEFKHDQAWGTRSFVAVTPLIGLLLAEWLSDWRRMGRFARALSIAVFCYAIALQVMSTTVTHTRWFLERDTNAALGLPPPAPMYFSQPGFARTAFANYFEGRQFRKRTDTDKSADSRAETFSYNYPNYWWAQTVALGANRWPLLGGVLLLLAIKVVAWCMLLPLLGSTKSFARS
jgi:hypothetical protein